MNRCATLAEYLALKPEFRTFGPSSVGSVSVAQQPAPGDVLTLTSLTALPVAEVYVTGTDFAVGADTDETAENLGAAISARALADAQAVGSLVHVSSVSSGPVSMLGMDTSNAAAFILSGPQLAGGDLWVQHAVDTACQQVNKEITKGRMYAMHVALACHYLTLQRGEERGVATKIKLDALEETFATPGGVSGNAALFGSTPCGREYLALRSSNVFFGIAGRAC